MELKAAGAGVAHSFPKILQCWNGMLLQCFCKDALDVLKPLGSLRREFLSNGATQIRKLPTHVSVVSVSKTGSDPMSRNGLVLTQ